MYRSLLYNFGHRYLVMCLPTCQGHSLWIPIYRGTVGVPQSQLLPVDIMLLLLLHFAVSQGNASSCLKRLVFAYVFFQVSLRINWEQSCTERQLCKSYLEYFSET